MYNYNKVTKKIAYVFVNTGCLDKEYKNAHERGSIATELFDDVFEFDEVIKYKDLPSDKVLQVFKKMRCDI